MEAIASVVTESILSSSPIAKKDTETVEANTGEGSSTAPVANIGEAEKDTSTPAAPGESKEVSEAPAAGADSKEVSEAPAAGADSQEASGTPQEAEVPVIPPSAGKRKRASAKRAEQIVSDGQPKEKKPKKEAAPPKEPKKRKATGKVEAKKFKAGEDLWVSEKFFDEDSKDDSKAHCICVYYNSKRVEFIRFDDFEDAEESAVREEIAQYLKVYKGNTLKQWNDLAKITFFTAPSSPHLHSSA